MPNKSNQSPARYTVGTLRAAGLEAKWGRNRAGAPMLFARNPQATSQHQKTQWWAVCRNMWASMNRDGIMEAFDNHTLLGDIFSVPA